MVPEGMPDLHAYRQRLNLPRHPQAQVEHSGMQDQDCQTFEGSGARAPGAKLTRPEEVLGVALTKATAQTLSGPDAK